MTLSSKVAPLRAGAETFERVDCSKVTAASQADSAIVALQFMLKLEREARATRTTGELAYFSVNSARKITNARQAFLLSAKSRDRYEMTAISSVASVDRNSPFVLAVEALSGRIAAESKNSAAQRFALPAFGAADVPELKSYPFGEMLWLPLIESSGKTAAALLLAKEEAWTDADVPAVARLAEVSAYSWEFLTKRKRRYWREFADRRAFLIWAVALVMLAFVPVPMTALAPAEVVARAPIVVTAPVEGVIDDIVVEPSARVAAGDVLFRFNDTQARNTFEVAEREVQVAEAKLRQARQGAFVDATYNREVAIAEADLAVKKSERDYARDILEKSVVRAERAGLVLFADKRDFVGRPVSVGQRVMEIANPEDVALRVLVPVDEAAALDKESTVRVFLDNDPLHPIRGHVTRAAYAARTNEGNQLSFRLDAKPDNAEKTPRLGLRGTAQVLGASVPLGFYLFRRPLSYVRQKLGV